MFTKQRKLISIVISLFLALVLTVPNVQGGVKIKATLASTETDIINIISAASPNGLVELVNDVTLTGTLIIPAGKNITITSSGGTYTLYGPPPSAVQGNRAIEVSGNLTLATVRISSRETMSKGIQVQGGGSLTMNTGSVITGLNDVHLTYASTYDDGTAVKVLQSGTFIMNGGEISYNYNDNDGGAGVSVWGDFTMNGGGIHHNEHDPKDWDLSDVSGEPIPEFWTEHSKDFWYGGGGVLVRTTGVFTMNGGSISNNSANFGGGIYCHGTMTINGDIENNTAIYDGGGAYIMPVVTSGVFYSFGSNASIINNYADRDGGGVYMTADYFTNTLSLATILVDGNEARENGGAVYLAFAKYVFDGTAYSSGLILPTLYEPMNLATAGTIFTNNTAGGSGGAIFDEVRDELVREVPEWLYESQDLNRGTYPDIDYGNISSTPATTFSGNSASFDADPPADPATDYPAINFTTTSIKTHPLNNYDINYGNRDPQYTVTLTYYANGGTGSKVETYGEGDPATILTNTAAGIAWSGHTFLGWNTAANGSGTSYPPGTVVTMDDDLDLYAQWDIQQLNEVILTYDANGGVGSKLVFAEEGDTVVVLTNTAAGISRSGYSFVCWSTESSGLGGMDYYPGDNITLDTGMTLFAQWRLNSGPSTGDTQVLPILLIFAISSVGILFSRKKKEE